jgi:hypothetical protein
MLRVKILTLTSVYVDWTTGKHSAKITVLDYTYITKLILAHLEKISAPFMETEGSLLCSNQSAICPYPQPDESSPQFATLLLQGKLSLCFNWAPSHEDLLGEWGYSSTHSLTSALDGGEW